MSNIVKAKYLTKSHIPHEDMHDSKKYPQLTREKTSTEAVMDERHYEMILHRMEKKAKHIEREARQRADGIFNSALKSSRKVMEEAGAKGYEEGFIKGKEEGILKGREETKAGLVEIERLIETLNEERKAIIEKSMGDFMDIAFALAEKIMKQHVKTDEEAVIKMMEEIIIENEEVVKVFFSEHQRSLDVRLDKETARKLRERMGNAKLVMVHGEDLIAVEKEGGIIDMSVPVQLAQLKKALDHATQHS